MEELIERGGLVIGKSLPVDKSALTVKGERRIESWTTSGLQAQPLQTSRSCFRYYVIEQGGSGALTEVIRMGAHGLQLANAVAQFLECAYARYLAVSPDRPNRHFRSSKPRQIERENAVGRGAGVHSCEVERQ